MNTCTPTISPPVPQPSTQTNITPYVLVVIDMQAGFSASMHEPTIAAVENEMRRAIEASLPIVVLEYAKYPATHERLLALLNGYDRFAIETKRDDDGSEELIEACLCNEYSGAAFRICGVNTHACVNGTATGLAEKLDESVVEVVKAACNDDERPDAWEEFSMRPNMLLI